ncbi:MAG: sugar nucleotide-binding protein, partial [Spirochaetota bacterium]
VHLAESIRKLIDTGAYGIYHVTSQGGCTRLEFARFVLKAAGRSEPVEIVDPATLNRKAKRPGRTVLDCRLYRPVAGFSLPSWQQGVKDYLLLRKELKERVQSVLKEVFEDGGYPVSLPKVLALEGDYPVSLP